MAVINFHDDIVSGVSQTKEVSKGTIVEDVVREYINSKGSVSQAVEIYNIKTGKTEFRIIETTGYKVLAIVNGVEVDLTYKIELKDVVSVIFVPQDENTGNALNVIFGVISTVAGIILCCTGVGGAAGACLILSGVSMLGGGIAGLVNNSKRKEEGKETSEGGGESEALLGVKGGQNQSIIGKRFPYVMGRHLVNPFIVGSPYHETVTENINGKEIGQWFSALYCVGYAPLRLTDFKIGEIMLAYNRGSASNRNRLTYMHGMLSELKQTDDGEIVTKWKNNDIHLEILQSGPDSEKYGFTEKDIYGTIYPKTVEETEVNANILYVYDKDIYTVAEKVYQGLPIPAGFRTNTVRFSRACPYKIEVELDFPNGLYSSRNEKHGDDWKVYYRNLRSCYAVQWRFHQEDSAPSDAEQPGDWKTFDYIQFQNSVQYPMNYDSGDAAADIRENKGLSNGTSSNYNTAWYNHPAFTVHPNDFSSHTKGNFNLNEKRFVFVKNFNASEIKTLLRINDSTSSDMDCVEVRVIRLTPCYIDQTTPDNKEENSEYNYQDVAKWTYLRTYAFDKDKYEEELRTNPSPADPSAFPLRPLSKEDMKSFCFVSLKLKQDVAETGGGALNMMSCIAESFCPKYDVSKQTWNPSNIELLYKYFRNIEDVYGDKKIIEITQKDYEEAVAVGDLDVFKEKRGSDLVSRFYEDLFNSKNLVSGNPIKKYALPTDIVTKYVTNNTASVAMLTLFGGQCGKYTKTYKDINLCSFTDFYNFCEDVVDGTVDKQGNTIHIKYACNGIVSAEVKTETLLQKVLLTGRAYITRDEDSKYKLLIGRPVKYPVAVLNQKNVLTKNNNRNFQEKPSGFQVSFVDESDLFTNNEVYVMNDGEDYRNPSKAVEQFSLQYVTNRNQIWSLARYNLAARIFQREAYTRTVGKLGYTLALGDVVLLQDDSLLVGTDNGGRIKEIIEDERFIYGFMTDEPFEYTGELDKNGDCIQGVTVVQPEKYGASRCVTLRLAKPEGTRMASGDIIEPTIGTTNVVVLKNPISKDSEMSEESLVDGDVCTVHPQLEDLVAFGHIGSITQKAQIMAIAPKAKGTFDLSLVPYDEKFYSFGKRLPNFHSNMTIPTREEKPLEFKTNITPADVSEMIARGNEQQSEKTKAPDAITITALAYQDGIKLSCVLTYNGLSNTIKRVKWQIVKKVEGEDDKIIDYSSPSPETQYKFIRATDGYPEVEDLEKWEVKAIAVNVYNKESAEATTVINTDYYGTWKLQAPRVITRVDGRSITLLLNQPDRTDGREVYGSVRHKIQIRNPIIDQNENVYFKPETSKTAYPTTEIVDNETVYHTNIENYKVANDTGFIYANNVYTQIVPLTGQGGEKPQISHYTEYIFKVVAENEAGVSEATVKKENAECSSIRDIVEAQEDAKKFYVSQLSAISANMGVIKEGTLKGNDSNYWALSDTVDETGKSWVQGAMRVGGRDNYFLVKPFTNDKHERDYNIEFKVGTFEVTTTQSTMNSNLVITTDSDSLERTLITPTGTFYQRRDSKDSDWIDVSKQEVKGLYTTSVYSNSNFLVTNAIISERRKDGSDVGKPYLSSNTKVYHFDTDMLDQHGEKEYTVSPLDANMRLVSGIGRHVDDEGNVSDIDFSPALLAVAPFSEIGQSLFGIYALKFDLGTNTDWTCDFWIKFFYAEGQTLCNIGTPDDSVQLVLVSGEPNYNEPLEGEPPYNYETKYSEELTYNHALQNKKDMYIKHQGSSTFEIQRLELIGEAIGEGEWKHIAIVSTKSEIKVYIGKTEIKFARYAVMEGNATAIFNDGIHSCILDELAIDRTAAESFESFKETTNDKVPWANLNYKNNYFILNANKDANGKPQVKTNIFESDDFIKAQNPIGTIIQGIWETAPEGYLMCLGQSVSKTQYADLYRAMGNIWGETDDSFILPNMAGRFPEGASSSSGHGRATHISAGLPNITGTFEGNVDDGETGKSGVFYNTGVYFHGSNGDASGNGGLVGFDASRPQDSIYGKSSTVQPASVCMNFAIKY